MGLCCVQTRCAEARSTISILGIRRLAGTWAHRPPSHVLWRFLPAPRSPGSQCGSVLLTTPDGKSPCFAAREGSTVLFGPVRRRARVETRRLFPQQDVHRVSKLLAAQHIHAALFINHLMNPIKLIIVPDSKNSPNFRRSLATRLRGLHFGLAPTPPTSPQTPRQAQTCLPLRGTCLSNVHHSERQTNNIPDRW